MPKLNGRPPTYSLHKPTGQAKVTMNGKVTYLGNYRSSESIQAYDCLIASLPKPAAPVPAPDEQRECVALWKDVDTLFSRDGSNERLRDLDVDRPKTETCLPIRASVCCCGQAVAVETIRAAKLASIGTLMNFSD